MMNLKLYYNALVVVSAKFRILSFDYGHLNVFKSLQIRIFSNENLFIFIEIKHYDSEH
jgi:hypothetical protein